MRGMGKEGGWIGDHMGMEKSAPRGHHEERGSTGKEVRTGTNLTFSLELIELVPSLAVAAEIDVELLAVRAVLLLVQAPGALEGGPMTGGFGDA